jgi:hypothetical protein
MPRLLCLTASELSESVTESSVLKFRARRQFRYRAHCIANLFRLALGETAGLFTVGVAPGAPLLTRNLARKGFDMHLAASYQV